MGMSSDLLSAFIQQLQSLSGFDRTQIAYENRDFIPDATKVWLRPSLLPAASFQAELGDTGMNMQLGIFQISVCCPANVGVGVGLGIADQLIELYKRGTVLAYGSVSDIKLVISWRAAAIYNAPFYEIPVSVRYYGLVSN